MLKKDKSKLGAGISVLFVGKGQAIPPAIAEGVPRRSLDARGSDAFARAVVGAVCAEIQGPQLGDLRDAIHYRSPVGIKKVSGTPQII